jgi:hypothetical protein
MAWPKRRPMQIQRLLCDVALGSRKAEGTNAGGTGVGLARIHSAGPFPSLERSHLSRLGA